MTAADGLYWLVEEMQEQTLFQDEGLCVTSERLIVSGHPYTMHAIVQVSPVDHQPNRSFAVALAVVGLFGSFLVLVPKTAVLGILSLCLVVVAAALFAASKPAFGVAVRFTSGSTIEIAPVKDRGWRDRVVNAIRQAMNIYAQAHAHRSWQHAQQAAFVAGQRAAATYVAAPVSVIERQILVVRCRYCGQMTPADLNACRSCGADSPSR